MECATSCGGRGSLGHKQPLGHNLEGHNQQPLGQSFGHAVSRQAKYIGSFSVDVDVLSRRSEAVRNHLNLLRASYHSGQGVVLTVSLNGIEVSSLPPHRVTLMEHSLKRISYATCDPSSCLFSFLARDPSSPLRLQQCHTFRLASPPQAEELNSIVGTAFRVAYALQLQSEGQTLPPNSKPRKCSDSDFLTQRCSSETPRCLRGATTAPRQFRCGPLSASRSAEDLIGVADEVEEEVESVKSCQGIREMASRSWQKREGTRQTQSEPGEQKVTLTQRRGNLRDHPFEQHSSLIGDDGSQHSYSVLEPPSPPPPPVNRPPKSSSSHVIACEVYSDVFEPSTGVEPSEGPWKTLDSSSSPWKTVDPMEGPWKTKVDPMEGPAHDSGLSSASASTNSSSGPSELEMETLGEDLSSAPWFQATMPRELAMSVLMREPLGSFMVRNSTSQPGTLALSVRVPESFHPEGITHYIIVRHKTGYKIKGFLKHHPSLTSLITHHSVMPELLPVPLNIHRHNPAFPPDRDSDYAALQDFSQLMRDLRLGESKEHIYGE